MSRLERIVGELGGVLLDNGRRALIAGPDHGPKDRSVSLMETDDGRILIHCFSPRDDWRRVRAALADKGLLDERPAALASQRWRPRATVERADEDRIGRARRWWSEGRPVAGTPAEVYLRQRAITAPSWNAAALRFHPRATSLDDRKRRPALLAALRDAAGRVQGVQITLLSTDGAAKADIQTPRRVIGKLIGGAVRLHAPAGVLIIAEGVETALSASRYSGHPVWALLTADNLARFVPPSSVQRVLVAQDNDQAGAAAAAALRERLLGSVEVSVQPAPAGHNDWNDWAASPRLSYAPR